MRSYHVLILLLIPFFAFSGVIPEKSRIVFNGKNTTQSYILVNTNNYPVVVQLWIDDGEFNANPELTPSPFVITPVMSKMAPSKINEIKIIYSGDDFKLPTDRESLYWLNIFEVPPVNKYNPAKNEIALSMLTQIKVLYRPENIEINEFDLIDKFDKLLFTLRQNDKGVLYLAIDNPTEYVASLANLTFKSSENNKLVDFKPDTLSSVTLLPKSTKEFPISITDQSTIIHELEYWLIDDQGKFINKKAKLVNRN